MTERFKLKDYGYDGWAVEDTTGEIFENDYIEDMSDKQVVDTMNKLYEENEHLKQDGEYWAKTAEARKKEINKLKEENEQLKKELKEFKDYVFSDEKILCYSCVNCISKGIYEVECSEKGKVDVHGICFLYWKKELKE